METVKYFFAATLIAVCINTSASPLSPTRHPVTYCELGVSLGYPNLRYNELNGSCESPLEIDSETKAGLYVTSDYIDHSKLIRITLHLNARDFNEKTAANKELVRVASGLAMKILGNVPDGLESTITANKSKSWNDGSWVIEVNNSETSMGYIFEINFKPKH